MLRGCDQRELLGKAGKPFWEVVPKLHIIFGEILLCADTWVYWHQISDYSSDLWTSLIGWLPGQLPSWPTHIPTLIIVGLGRLRRWQTTLFAISQHFKQASPWKTIRMCFITAVGSRPVWGINAYFSFCHYRLKHAIGCAPILGTLPDVIHIKCNRNVCIVHYRWYCID